MKPKRRKRAPIRTGGPQCPCPKHTKYPRAVVTVSYVQYHQRGTLKWPLDVLKQATICVTLSLEAENIRKKYFSKYVSNIWFLSPGLKVLKKAPNEGHYSLRLLSKLCLAWDMQINGFLSQEW